ncbi:MAG: hypothetical protein KC492_00945 [Myxococcales bacterium]|nr:hypothetical protein [Myxococcales bacterium]
MINKSQGWSIFDPSGELLVLPSHRAKQAPDGYEQFPAGLPWEWYLGGNLPPRTLVELYHATSKHCTNRAPDEYQLREMLDRVEGDLRDGRLVVFRRKPKPAKGSGSGGAGMQPIGAQTQEQQPPPKREGVTPETHPCDFETIALKCSHCPDSEGKRKLSQIDFKKQGAVTTNTFKQPPSGSKRKFIDRLQVVANHEDKGADDITIELAGGPGYTCGHAHPHIDILDQATGKWEHHQGETNVTFKAKCKKLPPPPSAYQNPLSLIRYYFFPQQVLNNYRVDIESCGLKDDMSRGFGRLTQTIDVFPSDTYKISLSIPSLKKLSYTKSKAQLLGDKKGTTLSSTETENSSPLLRKSETTSSSESSSGDKIETEKTYAVKEGRDGLQETVKESLDKDNNYSSSTELKKVDPVDHPVRDMAASFTFERNGKDVKGSETIGQFINALVNIQNEIQSVMNFINDFQPQVGWKFIFELELFKGDLSYEWGFKEWEDQSVYKWWKFEIGMTLFAVKLEVSFGASFKVAGVGITAVIFGNVSVDCRISASKEASPDKPEPWQSKLAAEPKGELGIRSALGADWVKAEGKLTCGFPFEAVCVASNDEPFHIDWKLEFTGVKAVVTGHVKFVGSISKEWTVMQPKKNWKTGKFPGGEDNKKPLKGKTGNIAA